MPRISLGIFSLILCDAASAQVNPRLIIDVAGGGTVSASNPVATLEVWAAWDERLLRLQAYLDDDTGKEEGRG